MRLAGRALEQNLLRDVTFAHKQLMEEFTQNVFRAGLPGRGASALPAAPATAVVVKIDGLESAVEAVVTTAASAASTVSPAAVAAAAEEVVPADVATAGAGAGALLPGLSGDPDLKELYQTSKTEVTRLNLEMRYMANECRRHLQGLSEQQAGMSKLLHILRVLSFVAALSAQDSAQELLSSEGEGSGYSSAGGSEANSEICSSTEIEVEHQVGSSDGNSRIDDDDDNNHGGVAYEDDDDDSCSKRDSRSRSSSGERSEGGRSSSGDHSEGGHSSGNREDGKGGVETATRVTVEGAAPPSTTTEAGAAPLLSLPKLLLPPPPTRGPGHLDPEPSAATETAAAGISSVVAIADASPLATVVTAVDGSIEYANSAWEQLCGYTLSEVRGLTCTVLQGPDTDLAAAEKFAQMLHAGHPTTMRVTNYTKGGAAFENNIAAFPVFGTSPAGCPGVDSRTITQQTSDGTALKRSRHENAPPPSSRCAMHFIAVMTSVGQCPIEAR